MAIDPRQAIIGTWRLVHSVEVGKDGQQYYPFGNDAIGYINYSESGVMAVQISRRARAAGDSEPRVGKKDYLAYFGRYELDVGKGLVRHLLESELFPGDHAPTLERKYHFYDDKLSLRPWDATDREILWQKV